MKNLFQKTVLVFLCLATIVHGQDYVILGEGEPYQSRVGDFLALEHCVPEPEHQNHKGVVVTKVTDDTVSIGRYTPPSGKNKASVLHISDVRIGERVLMKGHEGFKPFWIRLDQVIGNDVAVITIFTHHW